MDEVYLDNIKNCLNGLESTSTWFAITLIGTFISLFKNLDEIEIGNFKITERFFYYLLQLFIYVGFFCQIKYLHHLLNNFVSLTTPESIEKAEWMIKSYSSLFNPFAEGKLYPFFFSLSTYLYMIIVFIAIPIRKTDITGGKTEKQGYVFVVLKYGLLLCVSFFIGQIKTAIDSANSIGEFWIPLILGFACAGFPYIIKLFREAQRARKIGLTEEEFMNYRKENR